VNWQRLTQFARDEELIVERVRLRDSGMSIEGAFELPPLAKLAMDEQIFVTAFVRSHGSIKEMERLFGISYPTVKARLNKLSAKLDFVEVEPETGGGEVLEMLERGEINVKEAIERLRK